MKNRIARVLALVASGVIVGALVPVAYAGASASSHVKKSERLVVKHIDWANITDAGTLQVNIQDGIAFAAKKLDIKLTLFDNTATATKALQNAHLMTTNGATVAADFNITIKANKSIGSVFHAAKIPCIGVDIEVPGCVWYQLNNPGSGLTAGKEAAGIVKKKGWTGHDTTVLGLTTWSTGPFVNGIVTGFYQTFASTMGGMVQKRWTAFSPSVTKLGTSFIDVNCGLLPSTCQSAVAATLASVPSTRKLMVVGLNDTVVYAGLQAVNAAGRNANAAGVGLGTKTSIKYLRTDPQWILEDDIFYRGWGEYLVAIADGLMKGVKPKGNIAEIPSLVISKKQVDKYYGRTGTTPKLLPAISPKDKYLLKLGILQKFHNILGVK